MVGMGFGIALDVWPSVRVLLLEQIFESHRGISFILHTHPLGGVDVPFGVDDLRPTLMTDHLSLLTLIFIISGKLPDSKTITIK